MLVVEASKKQESEALRNKMDRINTAKEKFQAFIDEVNEARRQVEADVQKKREKLSGSVLTKLQKLMRTLSSLDPSAPVPVPDFLKWDTNQAQLELDQLLRQAVSSQAPGCCHSATADQCKID